MIYGSVCSGIEAATVAWHPLGWRAAFYSEIDKFPCALLDHYYDTPNYGDMNNFKEWPDATIDVLVGGTPCQSFSVAGLRKGLADPRGNLTLVYLAIAAKYRPRWLVWENVPGVLSDASGAFGAFLGGLGQLGYGFAYRILDAQYAGVPQRRRRVFVVGCLGNWRRAAAVLFERHSLQGNTAPSREARERVAPTISARTKGGGGLGTDFDCDGGLIQTFDRQSSGEYGAEPVASTVSARDYKGVSDIVTHSLRADGFDASEDGTGRTPIIAFSAKDHGGDAMTDCSPTLRAGGYTESHANAGVMPAIAFGWQNSSQQGASARASHTPTLDKSKVPAIAFAQNQRDEVRAVAVAVAGALAAEPGMKQQTYVAQPAYSLAIRGRDGMPQAELGDDKANAILTPNGGRAGVGVGAFLQAMQVRRLTPRECERLQGFPDDYTAIPSRGKPAADGPRYKALGNSMAVPCMKWIGERIAMVDAVNEIEAVA